VVIISNTKVKGDVTIIQLTEKEKALAELLSEECKTPRDLTAKLKTLFAGTLEKILEAELLLGYDVSLFILG